MFNYHNSTDSRCQTFLEIQLVDRVLVVDSRLIAKELDIQHKNLLATIDKYFKEIENDFGTVALKTRLVKRPQGGSYEERWYLLTEEQALYIMTLSKNTDRVRQCKRKLVKGFSAARKQLENQSSIQLTPAEQLLKMAELIVLQERRQKELEAKVENTQKVLALEAQRLDRHEELLSQHNAEIDRIFNPDGRYYTIRGYASLIGFNLTMSEAKALGKQATKLSKDMGLKIDKLPDPRYGSVNTYSDRILQILFD